MQFKDLKISAPVLKALQEENYSTPTPIQAKAIPVILDHHDVLGCAKTGTGKTAAFAIPIIEHLLADSERNPKYPKIKVLVLTPTRELAIQIGESFTTYGKHTNIKNTVIFGGVKQSAQVRALKNGVDILIATPGRLLDLIDQKHIRLTDINHFVLDEADRMLDMGFINDIKKLLPKLPQKRQSLFFSATMPNNIIDLSKRILNNPQKIEVSPISSTANTIQQHLYYTNKSDKRKLLFHILEKHEIGQVLIFSRTKHGADRIAKTLKSKNITSAALHGDKAQNQRQKALAQFKEGKIQAFVATDIAARGIDIDKLKHVINFDIPNEPETYVHRIGRCGRAGEEGIAISICEPEENAFVKNIEKLIKKSINVLDDNPFPQTDNPMNKEEKKEWEKGKKEERNKFFAKHKEKASQSTPTKKNNNKPKKKYRKNSSPKA